MDRAAIATTRAQVNEALHEVYDPELGVNILDLESLAMTYTKHLPGHLSTAALLFTPCGRTARPIRRLSPSPSHA